MQIYNYLTGTFQQNQPFIEEVVKKSTLIALGVFASQKDKKIFYYSMVVGGLCGLKQYFSESKTNEHSHDHKKNSDPKCCSQIVEDPKYCAQGVLAYLSGFVPPRMLSYLFDISVVIHHLEDHHHSSKNYLSFVASKVYVIMIGAHLGAWIGKAVPELLFRKNKSYPQSAKYKGY